jgi:hypothetical protein
MTELSERGEPLGTFGSIRRSRHAMESFHQIPRGKISARALGRGSRPPNLREIWTAPRRAVLLDGLIWSEG